MLDRIVREALARAPQGTSVGGDWLMALAEAVWESAQAAKDAEAARKTEPEAVDQGQAALIGALSVVRMRLMDATLIDARPSEVRSLAEYLRGTVDEALRAVSFDPLKAALMAHGYISRKRAEPVTPIEHYRGILKPEPEAGEAGR
jgi:hypothetical protein